MKLIHYQERVGLARPNPVLPRREDFLIQKVLAKSFVCSCLDMKKAARILLCSSLSLVKMAVVIIQLSFCYWYLLRGRVQ